MPFKEEEEEEKLTFSFFIWIAIEKSVNWKVFLKFVSSKEAKGEEALQNKANSLL